MKTDVDLDLKNFSHRGLSQPEPLPRGPVRHAELTGRVRAVLAATVADRWGQTVRVD